MNARAPAPKPPPLVSADTVLAGTLREQARAIMRWAIELQKAELSGDWAKVAEVRADIASCSTTVACFAADLEARAPKRPR